MKAISDDVLSALSAARIEGTSLFLEGRLDRKLYQAVARVIEAAGGKWDRKAAAHLFDGDATRIIDLVLLTGTVENRKQSFGQFDTPKDTAARLLESAKLRAGMRVLEPSAGLGNLAIPARDAGCRVDCVECEPRRAEHLRAVFAEGCSVFEGDFLRLTPSMTGLFDRVVMNPPFARQADIRHVLHAMQFLQSNGRLAAIMSAGVKFRQDHATRSFRAFAEGHAGTITDLPDGSFRESGTDVRAVIVTMNA